MDNRFISMSQSLSALKNSGNSKLKRFSMQTDTIDYMVPGIFSPIQQPSGLVCWATVATMMRCWQLQRSQTILTTVSEAGPTFANKFRNNQWLLAAEKIPFLNAMGLAFEYPQSLSIVGWERMLRSYGPIWITTAEGTDDKYSIHARILIGIRGDGTAAGTTLIIADPATGTIVNEKFSDFLIKFEREVRDANSGWDGRIQIVHFREATSQGKSLSIQSSISMSIDQAGVELIKRFEGFRASKYNDQAGHCTIGYGTLIHKGACNGDASEQPYNNNITEARATELLMERIAEFVRIINSNVNTPLNQNQFNALVSLVYNIGAANFQRSTLLRELNAGNTDRVPPEIRRWNKVRIGGVLQESEGLSRRRNTEANLFAGTAAAQSMSFAESMETYSKPFYDTGEHGILGTFINAATTGALANMWETNPSTKYAINGVGFTYGQIMTCGDFYEDFNQMSRANATELRNLLTLIQRSEAHYSNTILRIGPGAPDVKNTQWTGAIGNRYLDLALRNNSHFAPGGTGTTANNRGTWNHYHSMAITRARNGSTSDDHKEALKINAFGDHFLTDAFSAGHLVNKQQVMDAFLRNMVSGTTVTTAGDTMLKKVASGALAIREVNQELGRWELVETHARIHFDLNTTFGGTDIFYNVLKEVLLDTAHGGRQQIANLAAKAVHDFLNNYNNKAGVPVRNARGDSWNLSGDGTLNQSNINIIQQAVKQSIVNISDAITNASLSINTLQDRVLAFWPNLNDPTTSRIVNDAIATFTNPSSQTFIDVAVELVKDELDTLIGALKDAGKIRRVTGVNVLSIPG
ncbi:MAG: glycoside hydrolase family protein [Bacteroidetes bacterium]|nr:glycoside hydrolase family protein [Bacteroidota bacterium]